jgi:hypothetical protein
VRLSLPLECGGSPPILRLHASQQTTIPPSARRFLLERFHLFFYRALLRNPG